MAQARLLITLLLFTLSMPVLAEDALSNFEITPYVGYRGGGHYQSLGGDVDYDNDLSYGLIADIRARHNGSWQIAFGHHPTEFDTSTIATDGSKLKVDLDFLEVGGAYYFDGDPIRPFVTVTLGATRLSPDDAELESETYFSGTLGLGLRYSVTENLGLRLEGRAHGLFGKSNSTVFCAFGGTDELCFIAGDGGVIGQFEIIGGLTFRF